MLPMVLKRYEAEGPGTGAAAPGRTKKTKKEVVVPLRLDCSKFMTPAGGGKVRPRGDGVVGR